MPLSRFLWGIYTEVQLSFDTESKDAIFLLKFSLSEQLEMMSFLLEPALASSSKKLALTS